MKTLEATEEKLLSGPTVAREWNLDPATIRRWRREGAPFHVLGNNLIRYKLSELSKWRASRPVSHKPNDEESKEDQPVKEVPKERTAKRHASKGRSAND